MKTITTFIVSLTLFILSIAVIYYSINTLRYTSTTFYSEGISNGTDTSLYTFSFTFVLASVISFIFAIILIIKAIHYYSIHRKYYNAYMYDKRDREIKDKVENAKYNQLYEDLRDCETVELKEAVLKTFYSTKDIAKTIDKDRINAMMESFTREPFVFTPRKPGKTDYPDLKGFGTINFERKDPAFLFKGED